MIYSERMRSYTLFVFCLVGVFSLFPYTLVAQEPVVPEETIDTVLGSYPTERVPGGDTVVGDFVVGPGKIDVSVNRGDQKAVEMTITNRTGERRRFNITVQDATGSRNPNESIVLLGQDRGPYSLKDYLKFPHASFELNHNERARVPVTISIPPNASPGGLYGSVLVDTVAIDARPGEVGGAVPQSAIIARVGTLFFVTVPGDVARDGELVGFDSVPSQTFFTQGPIPLGILFENNGSVHLAPYGEIQVSNIFGEQVGFVELEPWFVFPDSLRLREVTFDRGFLFGRYTATIKLNRSYDNVIDEKLYTFYVLPVLPLFGIFVTLFLVLYVARFFFSRFEFRRKDPS